MNFKEKIYSSYRTSFKGGIDESDIAFVAKKNRPLLEPWLGGMKRDGRVVDLGCGAGELLWALKDMGFTDLHGVDLSEEQCIEARRWFPQVKTGNLFSYLAAQSEQSFDVVTIFDVIEHLTHQETFDLFDLIFTRLKPGGLLIAHVPNGLSPFVGQVFWGDMTHEWCLTPDSASTLCHLHGFAEYEAVEHAGASDSLKGRVRALAWTIIRSIFRVADAIETGTASRRIWTRCFAFKAVKPAK
jgi:SAM-dependent methyltransferase